MSGFTRRQHLKHLGAVIGAGAMPGLATAAFAADPEIPPQGIGKGIKHVRTATWAADPTACR